MDKSIHKYFWTKLSPLEYFKNIMLVVFKLCPYLSGKVWLT